MTDRLQKVVGHLTGVADIRRENKFYAELKATANAICSPGKGILAADESTGTIGKRLESIKLPNTRENRRAYRHLLFTTPELGKYISGAILFEETLYEKTEDGKTEFTDLLRKQGIIIGIKVDAGTKALPGAFPGETDTQGLDDLDKRCEKYYKQGARFAKWRAVLTIGPNGISQTAILANAWSLARYAAICQSQGLVPIVEPEVLMDGAHDIFVCQYWTEKVQAAVVKALNDNHVMLDCALLKPNMVFPGNDHPSAKTVKPEEIARATVEVLQRTMPASLVGVVFLSGGQSEDEATLNLNAMNALPLGQRPWKLTFSYGRALQHSCIKAWGGKPENVEKAKAVLLARAKANGEAQLGKFVSGSAASGAGDKLYVKDYKY